MSNYWLCASFLAIPPWGFVHHLTGNLVHGVIGLSIQLVGLVAMVVLTWTR